ncbi:MULTISPECIES: helix-turn-helix domain-containing protein [Nocardia]|jgi:transcriptional regulator with XRE-family HTH domain|uniref:helix-turn-helix domain-containing protein n=1 Tax=Nocardia TaxID=1817 RepID=UPI00189327ED|nr:MULTISPECIES: helix-turn-helix transcriptional regulator [Nocardia]MBF6326818.1 helix-turn-helix transcriptional regulator [Nocardia cyriacigeorgica]
MNVEQANAIVGANLRALRAKHDYSRERLSELSGVPVMTIRRLEGGERAAQVPALMSLCAALGVNARDFMDAVETELKQLANGQPSQ